MMNRTDLLAALRFAESALPSREVLPILSTFKFEKGSVLAFDDVLAIRAPCAGFVEKCMHGRTLLQFVAASTSKFVEVVSDDKSGVVLKLGRSRLTLSTFSADSYPITMPEIGQAKKMALSKSLLEAVDKARTAVGEDSLQLWSFGLTLELGANACALATNGFAIAHAAVSPTKTKRSVILPPRFVESILKFSRQSVPINLYIWDEWVGADFESGVQVFCRTVPKAEPKKIRELLDGAQPKGAKGIEVPKGFEASLARSQIFQTSPSVADRTVTFTIKSERLSVQVESTSGKMRDTFKVPGHSDVSVRAPAELIKPALKYADKILFSERCVLLFGSGFTYVVSGCA